MKLIGNSIGRVVTLMLMLWVILGSVEALADPAPTSDPGATPSPTPAPSPASTSSHASSSTRDPPLPRCVATSPSPWALHCGLTLEVGFGPAVVRDFGPYPRLDSILYGTSIGAGAWISPRVAIGGRIATAYGYTAGGEDNNGFVHAVAGPSLQYWTRDWFWASAGAGIAMRARSTGYWPHRYWFGAGLDGRLGATLNQGTRHTFNLAVEISPMFFFHPSVVEGLQWSYAVATLVLGYQYL